MAFHERLLSPRTLHLHAEELIWECKSGVQCECEYLNRRYGFEGLKESITTVLWKNESVAKLGRVWLASVTEYCGLRLTYESDRLPALSGLAHQFSGRALGSYVAGLWEHAFARGLLFECYPSESSVRSEPTQISCPSWSWASAHRVPNTRASYGKMLADWIFVQDPQFSVVGISLAPDRSNPFSWVKNGLLQLRGPCAMATLVPSYSNGVKQVKRTVIMKISGREEAKSTDSFIPDGSLEELEGVSLLLPPCWSWKT